MIVKSSQRPSTVLVCDTSRCLLLPHAEAAPGICCCFHRCYWWWLVSSSLRRGYQMVCELPLFHLKVLTSAHWCQGFHVGLQCGPQSAELLVQCVTAPGYLWHGVCHSVTACVGADCQELETYTFCPLRNLTRTCLVLGLILIIF